MDPCACSTWHLLFFLVAAGGGIGGFLMLLWWSARGWPAAGSDTEGD